MTINDQYSFLEAAVARTCDFARSAGIFGNMVCDSKMPTLEKKIEEVTLVLHAQREAHKAGKEALSPDTPPAPAVAPEFGVGTYPQMVMNTCCTIARTLKNAMEREDLGNGLDPTSTICEEIGFTLSNVSQINDILESDLAVMQTVQSYLLSYRIADNPTSEFAYMDLDTVHMWTQNEPTGEITADGKKVYAIAVDEKTGEPAIADNFDDAIRLMAKYGAAKRSNDAQDALAAFREEAMRAA
mgnify:CR=1 FL=1|tara:strand:- start:722 stop:1447 length:726 start_codon:yes stop_codon:yes gene_type:complete